MRFVVIEHAVMCTRVLIMSISPTDPDWVRDAAETMTFRKVSVIIRAHASSGVLTMAITSRQQPMADNLH
eukprot:COSAG01_NODE_11217_length_1980_cov_1.198830_2_plen_70_part_00